MGNCCLKKINVNDDEIDILFIGLGKVGKTSIFNLLFKSFFLLLLLLFI
jgi:GTPase SAR1 family protein